MERAKVRAFHEDLNSALVTLAKKHGFASASTGSISYSDERLSGSFRVFVKPGAENLEEANNLIALGLKANDMIKVQGHESTPCKVIGATNRGSLIVIMSGKRYRISPSQQYVKVGAVVGMTDELREKFKGLACRLSPENLSCDGELSRRATSQKHSEIMKEWKTLEMLTGHKVSQEEIEIETMDG